jgi:glyceraldehyde-3-phosphate dehydrogenase/erythrose-4-phosphate dehydrogenase
MPAREAVSRSRVTARRKQMVTRAGINDVTDARTLAHLLEYDSTDGRLGRR